LKRKGGTVGGEENTQPPIWGYQARSNGTETPAFLRCRSETCCEHPTPRDKETTTEGSEGNIVHQCDKVSGTFESQKDRSTPKVKTTSGIPKNGTRTKFWPCEHLRTCLPQLHRRKLYDNVLKAAEKKVGAAAVTGTIRHLQLKNNGKKTGSKKKFSNKNDQKGPESKTPTHEWGEGNEKMGPGREAGATNQQAFSQEGP